MAESKEFLALFYTRQQLNIGFKRNMVNLARALNEDGLIDDDCYDRVSQARSMFSDREKAEDMIRMVMDSIQLSKDNYHRLMKILRTGKDHRDLVKTLDDSYKKQGGTTFYCIAQENVQSLSGSGSRTVVSFWDEEIRRMNNINLIKYVDARGKKREIKILATLAPDWREVSEILGFEVHDIRAVENLGSSKTPENCLRDILTKWMRNASGMPNSKRFPNTWTGVHNLLQECLRSDVASDLKAALEAEVSDFQDNYDERADEVQPPPTTSTFTPPQSQPPASVPSAAQPTNPVSTHSGGAGGKRKKKNKNEIAEWLIDQGIDEDDVAALKKSGVSELLFMRLAPGHKSLANVSEATIELLPDLQGMLKEE